MTKNDKNSWDFELEQLLNVVVDLSAEAYVCLEEDEIRGAKENIGFLQKVIEYYMNEKNLRQVTECDDDSPSYLSEAYLSVISRGEQIKIINVNN